VQRHIESSEDRTFDVAACRSEVWSRGDIKAKTTAPNLKAIEQEKLDSIKESIRLPTRLTLTKSDSLFESDIYLNSEPGVRLPDHFQNVADSFSCRR